ncbi:MAG: DNA-3-methyladenine glycosylase 2 family protein [Phycisphaerae bacterium]
MWYFRTQPAPLWPSGAQFLATIDPTMARLVQTVTPCTLGPRRDYFVCLASAIFNQQISMAAATKIFARYRARFPGHRPTPAGTLKISQTELRTKIGLSRSKADYLHTLATHFHTGQIVGRKLRHLSDAEIIAALTAIRGIGVWSAEMFLIFCLNRPDVWPVDDLGLRRGVQLAYRMPALPTARELRTLGTRYAPWRSLATWYFWAMQGEK